MVVNRVLGGTGDQRALKPLQHHPIVSACTFVGGCSPNCRHRPQMFSPRLGLQLSALGVCVCVCVFYVLSHGRQPLMQRCNCSGSVLRHTAGPTGNASSSSSSSLRNALPLRTDA